MEGVESESNEEEDKNIGLWGKQVKKKEPRTCLDVSQNKEGARANNSTVRSILASEKRQKCSQERQALLESILRSRKANIKKLINKKIQKKNKHKAEGKVNIKDKEKVKTQTKQEEESKENENLNVDMDIEIVTEIEAETTTSSQEKKKDNDQGKQMENANRWRMRRINKMMVRINQEFKYAEEIEKSDMEKDKEKRTKQIFKGMHAGDVYYRDVNYRN